MSDIRFGHGVDVHAFGDGDHVMLCGVKVPHERGLRGHSDADVALHALTDALFGALAAGDIGQHFPPTDPQWKDVPSRLFVEEAVNMVHDAGGAINHVDVTIICQRPKLASHIPAMCESLSDMLGIDLTRISVKATTTERLGFTGREEGIAALATAVVILSNL